MSVVASSCEPGSLADVLCRGCTVPASLGSGRMAVVCDASGALGSVGSRFSADAAGVELGELECAEPNVVSVVRSSVAPSLNGM